MLFTYFFYYSAYIKKNVIAERFSVRTRGTMSNERLMFLAFPELCRRRINFSGNFISHSYHPLNLSSYSKSYLVWWYCNTAYVSYCRSCIRHCAVLSLSHLHDDSVRPDAIMAEYHEHADNSELSQNQHAALRVGHRSCRRMTKLKMLPPLSVFLSFSLYPFPFLYTKQK